MPAATARAFSSGEGEPDRRDGPSIAGEAAQAGPRPGSESSGKEPPREFCLRLLEKTCSPLDSVSSRASRVPGLRGAQADPGLVRGGASGCPSIRQPLVPLSRAETGLGAVASCGLVWGAVKSRGLVQCRRPPCGSFPLVHSSQSQAGVDGREETGKRRRPGWGAGAATQSYCDPNSPSAPRGTKVPSAASAGGGRQEAGGEISLTARQHLLAVPGLLWIPCPACGAALVVSSAREDSAPSRPWKDSESSRNSRAGINQGGRGAAL